MASPVIRVSGVSKKFALNKDKTLKERLTIGHRTKSHVQEFWALREVSFELEQGRTLGLIGANGSGKSTLLKIIGGILAPNAGFVERRGRLAALLELGAGFHPDLTGRENVYLNAAILGLARRQTETYFDPIVEFSGIEEFIDTQVKFYSSGMYVRLAFAVAVHVDPEILLVDEVLAVGDEPFQRKCLERIKQFQREGRTIVFVTHGLDQTRQLCDRVILLEHGRVLVDGPPVEALRTFRDQYAADSLPTIEQGSRELEIVKTLVTDGAGQPRDRFAPGDDLGIEVEVVAHEPTEDWVVGIAIHNQVETLIYGTNSRLLGTSLGPIQDRRRVRFNFQDIPIVEGQYWVTVALHEGDGDREYHRLDRTVSFKVFSTAGDLGVLHLSPNLELLDR
ncbi:MAG: ABC transporter ATP-binding protein [Mycobacteriales bacterium]